MTLDFDTVMPGHGVVFKGKAHIEAFQRYLRDVSKQATELKQAGVPADAAAPRIDMRAFATDFPQIRAAGSIPPPCAASTRSQIIPSQSTRRRTQAGLQAGCFLHLQPFQRASHPTPPGGMQDLRYALRSLRKQPISIGRGADAHTWHRREHRDFQPAV